MKEIHKPQLGFREIPLILVVGILSFVVHELGHGQLVSAAGPIVTIALALVGAWLIHRHGSVRIFPVVFFSAMMRAMAAFVSVANPNDEARVSLWLGIGQWTLPFLVIFALGWVTYLAGKKLELHWKSWAICFAASSIAITTVVLTEPHWPIIELQGKARVTVA